MARRYFVYILANSRKTVLYTGVTNDLVRRIWQHRNGRGSRFADKYRCTQLVYYELFLDSYNAISREKQLKAGSRRVKLGLIERTNPGWKDLYCDIAGSVQIATGPSGPRNDSVGTDGIFTR
jgi:putative endonuclease